MRYLLNTLRLIASGYCFLAVAAMAEQTEKVEPVAPNPDVLMRALIYDNCDRVAEYIEQGGEINLPEKHKGMTPLHLAAQHNRYEIAKMLLEKGADINRHNKVGDTPLHLAALNGHSDMVILLLRDGAEINACNRDGFTPLYMAIQHKHIDLIDLLVVWGADINARTRDKGLTPLHWAAFFGCPRMVDSLLASGANINATDNRGRTPFEWAASAYHSQAARLLARRGGHWASR